MGVSPSGLNAEELRSDICPRTRCVDHRFGAECAVARFNLPFTGDPVSADNFAILCKA